MAYGTSHSSASSPISNLSWNNNYSIQCTGYLLTCRLNSTSVCYKANAKTQIKHKNSTNTQRQSTKQKQCGKENQYKNVLEQKP